MKNKKNESTTDQDMDEKAKWVKDDCAPTDQWQKRLEEGVHAFISQYERSGDYCWQVVRGEHRLSGILPDQKAAMNKAIEVLDMPVDEFNKIVMVELRGQLDDLERKITELAPNELIGGYASGYKKGVTDTKLKIISAMGLEISAEALTFQLN